MQTRICFRKREIYVGSCNPILRVAGDSARFPVRHGHFGLPHNPHPHPDLNPKHHVLRTWQMKTGLALLTYKKFIAFNFAGDMRIVE